MPPSFLLDDSNEIDDLADSLNSVDLEEKEKWNNVNREITNEVQDIMVDVVVLFSALPVLLDDEAVLRKWNAAFESLFDIVKGLRSSFGEQKRTGPFEGRPGRFYLAIEEEYFLTCFYQEFYEFLAASAILGDLEVDQVYDDPADDLNAVYEYVRSHKNAVRSGRATEKRRASSLASLTPGGSEERPVIEDDGSAVLGITAYLNHLVDAGTDSPDSDNLLVIAKAIDTREDSSIYRFFFTFRRQEFALLYRPIKHSVNGAVLVEVLARYYLEYISDTRVFNAPSLEMIVRDMKRNRKCDTPI